PGPLALGCYLFTPKIVARNLTHTKVVQRGERRATKRHRVQINLYCTKYTGGCTAQACDGFPSPSQVPPKWNQVPPNGTRSPGVPPRRRGFSFESIARSLCKRGSDCGQ